jgi:hypothetical protein
MCSHVSATFEKVATYYVLLSWLYDAFNELPYLRLRGDFGSGKTRALLTIGSLCYKPFFASGASTVSPIFHTPDAFRGTLIFDEADFRFSDERAEIVKILNNGDVRGLPVLREPLGGELSSQTTQLPNLQKPRCLRRAGKRASKDRTHVQIVWDIPDHRCS